MVRPDDVAKQVKVNRALVPVVFARKVMPVTARLTLDKS